MTNYPVKGNQYEIADKIRALSMTCINHEQEGIRQHLEEIYYLSDELINPHRYEEKKQALGDFPENAWFLKCTSKEYNTYIEVKAVWNEEKTSFHLENIAGRALTREYGKDVKLKLKFIGCYE